LFCITTSHISQVTTLDELRYSPNHQFRGGKPAGLPPRSIALAHVGLDALLPVIISSSALSHVPMPDGFQEKLAAGKVDTQPAQNRLDRFAHLRLRFHKGFLLSVFYLSLALPVKAPGVPMAYCNDFRSLEGGE
jgi:hypothetical protein